MKKRIAFGVVLCSIAMALSVQAMAFADVSSNAWYEKDVRFVAENGLMNGVEKDRFAPEDSVSRGMLVTVLFRMDGAAAGDAKASFADVKKGSYYEDAVAWAESKRIVTGYSEARFGPDDIVTREQLVTILYRYAASKGYDVSASRELLDFSDASEVSSYAKSCMEWAVGSNLIGGVTATRLVPQGSTTRAQLAAIIARFSRNGFLSAPDQNGAPGEVPGESPGANDQGNNQKPEGPTDSVYGKEPTIYVQNVTARAGEESVKVAVLIKNNPGVLGLSLRFFYDESRMTLVGLQNGDAVKRSLSMTAGKKLVSGCRVIWDGVEVTQSDIADGEILIMTFLLKAPAERGEYPIRILCDTAVDNDLSRVPVKPVDGSVAIER